LLKVSCSGAGTLSLRHLGYERDSLLDQHTHVISRRYRSPDNITITGTKKSGTCRVFVWAGTRPRIRWYQRQWWRRERSGRPLVPCSNDGRCRGCLPRDPDRTEHTRARCIPNNYALSGAARKIFPGANGSV